MFTGIRTGGHGELGRFLVVSNIGLSFFWFWSFLPLWYIQL